jgi:transposase
MSERILKIVPGEKAQIELNKLISEEIEKCCKDPMYFLNTYWKIENKEIKQENETNRTSKTIYEMENAI